ncbi:unnamed protein product [Callosobruchus maculatus]
MKTKN